MSVRKDFEVGRQPCNSFNPQEGSMQGIINEHQCPECLLSRSFCLNCSRDHHYKGWDLCEVLIENKPNEIIDHLPQEKDYPIDYGDRPNPTNREILEDLASSILNHIGEKRTTEFINLALRKLSQNKEHKQPTKEVPDIRGIIETMVKNILKTCNEDTITSEQAIEIVHRFSDRAIQEISALYRKETMTKITDEFGLPIKEPQYKCNEKYYTEDGKERKPTLHEIICKEANVMDCEEAERICFLIEDTLSKPSVPSVPPERVCPHCKGDIEIWSQNPLGFLILSRYV